MKPYRFPTWFRAAVAALFTGVFIVYFLVKDGLVGASARSAFLAPTLQAAAGPLVRLQAMLARSGGGEPKGGAYSINGMRVAYDTLPAPLGARETLARFARGYQQAGFRYRLVDVEGQYTLVGVHPQTKVMLTARPGRDRAGRSIVRISQQNLAELDPHFKAVIPGVPVIDGATHPMLVRSLEGPPSESLMFAADASPEWVKDYYARELPGSGWQRLEPPLEPPSSFMTLLFFSKGSTECSVVAMPNPDSGGSLVLVNVGGKADRRS